MASIEFEVRCSWCGNNLEAKDVSGGIEASPCEKCLEAAREEGRNEGYNERDNEKS